MLNVLDFVFAMAAFTCWTISLLSTVLITVYIHQGLVQDATISILHLAVHLSSLSS